MRVSTQLSVLLAAASTQVSAQTATTGKLGDAAEVNNNPVGVVYKATLPETAFFKDAFPDGGNIKGEVTAEANTDGKGVKFTVKLSNLPKTGGPFPYHLHVAPVPEGGNCTETLAHLDPYVRGEDPACDSAAPATCQVGDLSGKHGKIPAGQDTFEASYVDAYASTLEGIGAFFGNRSVVFHYPNKTRITCASFEKVEGTGSGSGSSSSSSSSAAASATLFPSTSATLAPSAGLPPKPTSTVALGAASGLRASVAGAVVLGAAAAFLL